MLDAKVFCSISFICVSTIVMCVYRQYRPVYATFGNEELSSMQSVVVMNGREGSHRSTKQAQTVHRELVRTNLSRMNQRARKSSLIPECDDILNNMTNGKWVKRSFVPLYDHQTQPLPTSEDAIQAELHKFWVKRGIQTAFWRKDFQCGYYNYETQPRNTQWPKVGSWCNPNGDRPCCSNSKRGTCMKPSNESCNCVRCIDLRSYKYAELSEWIVDDRRCKWKNYNASEICEVIERSPFSDIQFVGDSFLRNMFRTFAMMVTNDFDHGAVNASTSNNVKSLCTKMQQYFWKQCRKTLSDLSKTLYPKNLCGGRGHLNFSAKIEYFYSNRFTKDYLKLVKSKVDVHGSLIVLGVGFHMQCNANKAIEFLRPAINAIDEYYGNVTGTVHPKNISRRWPQIILCLPLTIGLLKPTAYLGLQNQAKCDKYCFDMKVYCDANGIQVLDFRELTKLIYSFDGTHHGIAVNKMKNLMLLNYIASIT